MERRRVAEVYRWDKAEVDRAFFRRVPSFLGVPSVHQDPLDPFHLVPLVLLDP